MQSTATKLSFTCDNLTATAGETLNGTLSIAVKSPVRTTGLDVYFRGKEYTTVTKRSGKHSHTYHEKQQLARTNFPTVEVNRIIQTHNNTLPPGNYQVRFSFDLNSNLPSSCFYGNANKRGARVIYCLRAVLKESGTFQNHETRQAVHVRAEPKPIQTIPRQLPPLHCPITAGAVFSKGRISAGAQVDDTLLVPGQKLKLDLAMINDSLATVHSVRVVLQEKAKWFAKGHHGAETRNLIDVTSNVRCEKSSSKQELKQKLEDPSGQQRNSQSIEEELATRGENVMSVLLPPLPDRSQNSYSGRHLTISHNLTITLGTKALRTNPTLRIPLQIQRAETTRENLPIAMVEPAVVEPAVVEPAVVEPAVVEPLGRIEPYSNTSVQQQTDLWSRAQDRCEEEQIALAIELSREEDRQRNNPSSFSAAYLTC